MKTETKPKRYVTVKTKLIISSVFAICWLLFSIWLSQPWIATLIDVFTIVPAIIIISGIAFIPGVATAFLAASILQDNRPKFEKTLETYPDLTIMIAAYNEESAIESTLDSIALQKYPGNLTVLVADDGSSDSTVEKINSSIEAHRAVENLTIVCHPLPENVGKAMALNEILAHVKTEFIVTVDADTYLFKSALQNIVLNLVAGPPNTAAVAGAVAVRNSRANWLTKLQEWDYFHAMASVKRVQSLFQGTMVAQGAFSIYHTEYVRDVGGWPDTVGEDIVLTWALRDKGYRISYDETAIAFTDVPDNYPQFFNQRKRWSRGLIEAFKQYPKSITTLTMTSPFIWFNLAFPFVDSVFLFVFAPGVIAAIFFQWYAIAGLMTLVLLPMTLLVNYLIYVRHAKTFHDSDLKVRKNKWGFVLYVLVYQFIMAPACVAGYYAELLNLRKTWGTK